MKTAIIAFAFAAGTANAGVLGSGQLSTFADNFNNGDAPNSANTFGSGITGEFSRGNNGLEGPNNGVRFLNAQNTGNTTFDSWAAVRWDLSDFYGAVSDEVAATAGATGFEITGVTAVFTYEVFTFSGATDVNGYWIEDDALNFDPQSAAGLGVGGPNIEFGLFSGANAFAADWSFRNTFDGDQDIVDISSAEILADLNSGNDALTFAFESSGGGNAAYRGSSAPFGGRNAPELRIAYNIVPAPASAAVLGLGGLVAARRRRA